MEVPRGELPLANTSEQFDSCDRVCCTFKVFEAEHRFSPEFDTAVILLDQVVQIF
jgi:hypothetical protein